MSLMAAIFKDALRCTRRVNGSVTHRDSSEAAEWIASERSDRPFAFVNVCEVLGVPRHRPCNELTRWARISGEVVFL
jgi:hypothetical protein